jgi:HEAT repeat protein
MSHAASRLAVAVAVCIALLTAACSSTPPRERLTFEQLEEAQREGIEAIREGGERWERTVAAAAEDDRLALFLAENLAVELVRLYERGALSRAGSDASPYERVRRAIGQLGPPAHDLLASMVAEGDDVVAGCGIDALVPLGPVAVEQALRLSTDGRDLVRRRAFELIGRLGPASPADEDRIATCLRRAVVEDASWVVRAEAARAAGRRAGDHVPRDRYVSLLLHALADADPTVLGRAADGLANFGDPRAVPGLVEALSRVDGQIGAHDRVQRALKTLLGEPRNLSRDQWWQVWIERREALLAPRARP